MLDISQKVEEIRGIDPAELPAEVLLSKEPLVLKGLVATWPIVKAGKQSTDAAIEYLGRFYDNATIGAFFGEPEIEGRVFYNEDMTGFNYQPVMLKLDQFLEKIQQHASDEEAPALYLAIGIRWPVSGWGIERGLPHTMICRTTLRAMRSAIAGSLCFHPKN